MSKALTQSRPLTPLLLLVAIIIIVGDQLSKAWFVFKLGTHNSDSFEEFCSTYFRLLNANTEGSVVANYSPFSFDPMIVWDPWIQFNLTTNTGAAWSIFRDQSFVLSFVSLVMAGVLFYIWHRHFRYNTGMTWAMAGIIGGALGNFLDRFRLREVVDFIDVKIPYLGKIIPSISDPYDFPIFNVADSGAVCGTVALAIYLIIVDINALKRRRKKPPKPPSPFPEGPGLDYDPAIIEEMKQRSKAGTPRGDGPRTKVDPETVDWQPEQPPVITEAEDES